MIRSVFRTIDRSLTDGSYIFILHLYSHAPLLDRGIDDPLYMCIELE